MAEAKKTATKAATSTVKKHENLVAALAAFQADLPTVSLDSTNPHFKSKFTSLGNLTTTVFPKLAEHGLVYSATSSVRDDGRMIVKAQLLHEGSDDWLDAEFPVTQTDPQKIGSAVSYYRRYGLAMLTGVVADQDDDGNVASAPEPKPLQNVRQKAAQNAAPAGNRSEAEGLKAQIRAWIGEDEQRKAQAVEVQKKLQGEGESGTELQKAMIAELGA